MNSRIGYSDRISCVKRRQQLLIYRNYLIHIVFAKVYTYVHGNKLIVFFLEFATRLLAPDKGTKPYGIGTVCVT